MMRLSRRFARLRRWLLRRDYVALATQVAISLLILLLVALVTGGRRGDVTVSEERTLIRDEQPQAVAQPERPEAAIVAVSPAPATKPADLDPAQAPAFEMAGPFLSVDGTSLRRGDGVVSLDRVEGPRADDVCEDAGGALWACGLHARAALHNLLTGRGLVCTPKRVSAPGTITADCRFRAPGGGMSGDLAADLVRLGWARPLAEAAGELAGDEEAARREATGLWRGGWTIRRR